MAPDSVGDFRLRSLSYDYFWTRGTNTAQCANGVPHTSPESDCSCGFYALKPVYAMTYSHSEVFGDIEMWGHVIEGSLGYRAQYARITKIRVPKTFSVGRLERLYPGIPILYDHSPPSGMELHKSWMMAMGVKVSPHPRPMKKKSWALYALNAAQMLAVAASVVTLGVILGSWIAIFGRLILK